MLDGVSVEYPDWHFNVRASNTEPLIRLNLEATTAGDHGSEARRGAGLYPRLMRPASGQNRDLFDARNKPRRSGR